MRVRNTQKVSSRLKWWDLRSFKFFTAQSVESQKRQIAVAAICRLPDCWPGVPIYQIYRYIALFVSRVKRFSLFRCFFAIYRARGLWSVGMATGCETNLKLNGVWQIWEACMVSLGLLSLCCSCCSSCWLRRSMACGNPYSGGPWPACTEVRWFFGKPPQFHHHNRSCCARTSCSIYFLALFGEIFLLYDVLYQTW